MTNYIICFKKGNKIRVRKDVAEDICVKKEISGYYNLRFLEGDKKDSMLICLNEILYIQPESLEINLNGITFTTPLTPNSSGTTFIPPQTQTIHYNN